MEKNISQGTKKPIFSINSVGMPMTVSMNTASTEKVGLLLSFSFYR